MERYDDVVVGGGHNGLVAACYLAQAGRSVLVIEQHDHPGGAAASAPIFPGVDARLSRYAYLVSLLPDQIVSDLRLDIRLRSRPLASYTPTRRAGRHTGLLVESEPGPATAASFRDCTGTDHDYAAWPHWNHQLGALARGIAPTLLEPLPSAETVRARVGPEVWDRFVATPLGHTIEDYFDDDVVRGMVLTDGLIGTFSHAHDPALRQNRCFLYHVIGNGDGQWRVPVGGMGTVSTALAERARSHGVRLLHGATATSVHADGDDAEVTIRVGDSERRVGASYVLAAVAPPVLNRLRGHPPATVDEGAQVKINVVLSRLPALRSGIDPRIAFAGTFHLNEEYGTLRSAYEGAVTGRVPTHLPSELYCHTLTDPTILGADLAQRGWHTLTLFGLQMPARLFDDGSGAALARSDLLSQYFAGLNAHLDEPIEECLAHDAEGNPCVELTTPPDLENTLGMPRGHIFHGDLAWPWAEAADEVGIWGVETDLANVLVCGAGARRGGGVSGIGGHNAARAVLERAHAPAGQNPGGRLRPS